MSTKRFTPEFKQEAVRQIVDRGHSVSEVSARLGVSAHSLYQWVKAATPDKAEKQVSELLEAKSEILKLRAQLRRTEEERDILKKQRGTSPKSPSEVPLHQRSSADIPCDVDVPGAASITCRVLSVAAPSAIATRNRGRTSTGTDPRCLRGQRWRVRIAPCVWRSS